MTTTAAIGDHLGLLDKERIIAPADYNRWLVPPAALAIHLCIGMAYGFSVFWKPLQGALLGADGKAVPECSAAATTFGEKAAGHAAGALHHELQLEPVRSRLDVHPVLRVARHLCRHLGRLARAGWATQSRRGRRLLLERWLSDFGTRRLYPPALADVAWLGHHRRLRSRPRLHLSGLDPDQMVP
jgi:hypothetical protein